MRDLPDVCEDFSFHVSHYWIRNLYTGTPGKPTGVLHAGTWCPGSTREEEK